MVSKLKEVKTALGIPILVEVFEHEYEDEILLFRIRESQRLANYVGGIVHEPGNQAMSDIPVDEDFSKLCSERLM